MPAGTLVVVLLLPLVTGCNFFGTSGTDYGDANLSVIQLGNTSTPLASCCDACTAWNTKPPATPETNCSIGVVLAGRLCALKASSYRPFSSQHATAVQPGRSMPHPNPMANLDLIVLPKATADAFGAKCLDGSPPALYFKVANTSADPSAATSWVLFFKGGGWCDDEVSCAGRAQGLLGSSTELNATQPKFGYGGGGPVGADPAQNPSFSSFNRVILWYCCGGSFTGDRTDPITVNGSQVWFRGRRNLVALLSYLTEQHGLADATEVLVSGGSAGGLSAYIHADFIRSTILQRASSWRTGVGEERLKIRAAPVSGFFLNHRTLSGSASYEASMRGTFEMMNSTSGVNAACAAAHRGEEWRCIFANESWSYTTTATFPLNSAIDAYQISDILGLPNKHCAGLNVGVPKVPGPQMANCSRSELAAIAHYERDFMSDVRASPAFGRPGAGGFIESCVEHCEGMADGWQNVTSTRDGVSMQQALTAWWDAPERAPAEGHWHLPCSVNTQGPVGQCNPSCTVK